MAFTDWAVLAGLVVAGLWWLFRSAQKRGQAQAQAEAGTLAAEADGVLDAENTLAILVQNRSKYARNFAKDMLNETFSDAEREHYRRKYEEAKTSGLTDLLTIKDEFYRGVAAHGIIDLLLEGHEVDAAKRIFDNLDPSLQEMIVATGPDEYACLRA